MRPGRGAPAPARRACPETFAPSAVLSAAFACAALALGGCGERSPTEVSEAPPALEGGAGATTEPRVGRLAIRARVAYADLEAIAVRALPERRPERGSRRLCRRVVGLPVCGTARWDVVLARTDPPRLSRTDDERVAVTLPLRIDGEVGLDGRVADLLGLDALAVEGAALATAHLALDLDERWCPRVKVTLEHAWTERPTLGWTAGIDIDLAARLDAVIARELERLPARLEEAIDCERFRERLGVWWRAHRVPLSLPDGEDVWLNIEPTGFGFSGVRAEPDALGVGFALEATTLVSDAPSADTRPPLPPLERVAYAPGRTSFEVLVRAPWARLDALAAPALIGRTFRAGGAAGDVSVEVTSVAFSGSADGASVALGFAADLPATWRTTRGVLHLTARPVVDTAAERISLADIRLSRVLDNRLWSLVSHVFEGPIVAALERASVLELGERTRELERRLVAQLADPERTAGLVIDVRDVDVRLLSLVPEAAALAAVARVDATLDVDVPLDVLEGFPD